MSDTNETQEKQKAAKIRRKSEGESVLQPTFAVARHSTNGTLWDRDRQGSGLLQRQCACGTHTIAGSECDTCRQRHEAGFLQRTVVNTVSDLTAISGITKIQTFPESRFAHDFSQIPLHSIIPTNPIMSHYDLRSPTLTQRAQQAGMVQAQHALPSSSQDSDVDTSSTTSRLQRVQDAIAANNLEALVALQHELRQQMLTDPLHPPEDARVALATARHWAMDQIAAIRDTYESRIQAASTGGSTGTDGTGAVETLETSMDVECTPYLNALMEGDPQYRYEHFNTTVSEKVFAAVRLHSARRAVGQIGHRDAAEAEARSHGKVSKEAWCGAFAYTQAEQGGGFDSEWAVNMQGEGGIRSALAPSYESMKNTWIWVFDHWEKLKDYHDYRKSLRWYEEIHRAPPSRGIQAGDLVLIDNTLGTNPDHITTAISFDGRFLTTVGGNQGAGEAGVSRSKQAFDIQNNPEPNDVRKKNAEGKRIQEADPTLGPKHVRIHGIGRWSVVDYERHIYKKSQKKPIAPPSATKLAALG